MELSDVFNLVRGFFLRKHQFIFFDKLNDAIFVHYKYLRIIIGNI